mgnify:CR=1 FL=1|tara:strand:- start:1156 stop:2250 length:1095 start_codon:yes stop_codon:yes gene_type:complete
MHASVPDRSNAPAAGQPLRFIGLFLLLWIGGRIAANGNWIPERNVGQKVVAIAANAALPTPVRVTPKNETSPASYTPAPEIRRAPIVTRDSAAHISSILSDRAIAAPMPITPIRTSDSPTPSAAPGQFAVRSIPIPPTAALPVQSQARQNSWSGSAWLFWRANGDSARSIGSAGQLGGPQAGVRIEKLVARAFGTMPVAPYARLSAALRQPHMPEAALGIAIRPLSGRMPVTLGVERRIALDTDSRNAFALVAATGINPTPLTDRLIIEGYAQAGMVGLSRTDPFADGRLALGTPIDKARKIITGLSISGGAQPSLARLDVGPMLQMRLPIKGMNNRLSVEWRERIAGNTRPGSGLAITLGVDF